MISSRHQFIDQMLLTNPSQQTDWSEYDEFLHAHRDVLDSLYLLAGNSDPMQFTRVYQGICEALFAASQHRNSCPYCGTPRGVSSTTDTDNNEQYPF